MNPKALQHGIQQVAAHVHDRLWGLRKLPLPAVVIVLGLVVANAVAWAGVGIALVLDNYLYYEAVADVE